MERHGYTVADLQAGRETPAFRLAMRDAVSVARGLFVQGLPLVDIVDRRLGTDLELFSRGGIRILDKIEQLDGNVLARRPHIGKAERVRLLLGTLARRALAGAA